MSSSICCSWNRCYILFLWTTLYCCGAQRLLSHTQHESTILSNSFIGFDKLSSTYYSHYLQNLHLLNASALNHNNALVSWQINPDFYKPPNKCDQTNCDKSWAITINNLDIDSTSHVLTDLNLKKYMTQQITWQPTSNPYIDILGNLLPETNYQICLSLVMDSHSFQEERNCKSLKTKENDVSEFWSESHPKNLLSLTKANSGDDSLKSDSQLTISKGKFDIFLSWSASIFTRNNSSNDFLNEQLPLINNKGWKIRIRKFADENETEIVLLLNKKGDVDTIYNYTIPNLEPQTGYILCFEILKDENNINQKEFLTSDDASPHINEAFQPEVTEKIESELIKPTAKPDPISTTENAPPQKHYVYTSTGQRIAVPSIPGVPFVAGSFPVSAPFFEAQDTTSNNKPNKDSSAKPFNNRSLFRRKRSMSSDDLTDNPAGQCYEIVTEDNDEEYVLILSLIIAIVTSMILTIVTFFICCWLKKCYKNNVSLLKHFNSSNK